MIFLTGLHGSGKTTMAKYLLRHNFDYIELGSLLRQYHKIDMPGVSFESWCKINEGIKGNNFTDDIIVNEIQRKLDSYKHSATMPQDILIVGSRSKKGINYIIKNIKSIYFNRNLIIYIHCSVHQLKIRYCEREGIELTEELFEKILKKDERIGILSVKACSHVVIDNEGDCFNFIKEIDKVIFEDLNFKKNE